MDSACLFYDTMAIRPRVSITRCGISSDELSCTRTNWNRSRLVIETRLPVIDMEPAAMRLATCYDPDRTLFPRGPCPSEADTDTGSTETSLTNMDEPTPDRSPAKLFTDIQIKNIHESANCLPDIISPKGMICTLPKRSRSPQSKCRRSHSLDGSGSDRRQSRVSTTGSIGLPRASNDLTGQQPPRTAGTFHYSNKPRTAPRILPLMPIKQKRFVVPKPGIVVSKASGPWKPDQEEDTRSTSHQSSSGSNHGIDNSAEFFDITFRDSDSPTYDVFDEMPCNYCDEPETETKKGLSSSFPVPVLRGVVSRQRSSSVPRRSAINDCLTGTTKQLHHRNSGNNIS